MSCLDGIGGPFFISCVCATAFSHLRAKYGEQEYTSAFSFIQEELF